MTRLWPSGCRSAFHRLRHTGRRRSPQGWRGFTHEGSPSNQERRRRGAVSMLRHRRWPHVAPVSFRNDRRGRSRAPSLGSPICPTHAETAHACGSRPRVRAGREAPRIALDLVLVLSYSHATMHPPLTNLVRARRTRQMSVWRSGSAA